LKSYGNGGISLLAFSFLCDLFIDQKASLNDQLISPIRSDEELKSRLTRARQAINRSCKNLLVVTERHSQYTGPAWTGTALRYDVDIPHRSLYHFIQLQEIQSLMAPHLQNFSVVNTICQITIAMVKSLSPVHITGTKNFGTGYILFFDREFVGLLNILHDNRHEIEDHIDSLNYLDDKLHQLRCQDCLDPCQIDPDALGQRVNREYLPYFACSHFEYAGLSLHHAAAGLGLYEYALRLFDNDCSHRNSPWKTAAMVDITIDIIEYSKQPTLLSDNLILLESILQNFPFTDIISTVKLPLIKRVTDDSFKSTTDQHEISLTVWQRFLFNLRFFSIDGLEALDLFLKFNFNPKFRISIASGGTPYYEVSSPDVEVLFPSTSDDIVNHHVMISLPSSNYEQLNLYSRKLLPLSLFTFIQDNGGSASLRELIEFSQFGITQGLLDRLDQNVQLSESHSEVPENFQLPGPLTGLATILDNSVVTFALGKNFPIHNVT
jgi:hypothetical protein